MAILPDGIPEQIQFCETHIPVWTAQPTKIGLTAAQVTALATATTAARAAFSAAQAAREASKGATTNLGKNVTTMRSNVSDLIRQIKAFAEISGSPEQVYADAQIPPPAAPSPAPVPGKPSDFNVALNPDGSVTLSWNATNSAASSGAFFNVSRKLPGQSNFVPLGGASGSTAESRRASFTDTTVPASAASAGAQYIVQGFRGTRAGEASDAMVVQFGADGVGVVAAAGSTSANAIKLAA